MKTCDPFRHLALGIVVDIFGLYRPSFVSRKLGEKKMTQANNIKSISIYFLKEDKDNNSNDKRTIDFTFTH